MHRRPLTTAFIAAIFSTSASTHLMANEGHTITNQEKACVEISLKDIKDVGSGFKLEFLSPTKIKNVGHPEDNGREVAYINARFKQHHFNGQIFNGELFAFQDPDVVGLDIQIIFTGMFDKGSWKSSKDFTQADKETMDSIARLITGTIQKSNNACHKKEMRQTDLRQLNQYHS